MKYNKQELWEKYRILLADNAGACFGVRRALRLTMESLEKYKRVYTIGPLIHNPQVVEKLESKGALVAETVYDVTDNYPIVLRSHGVSPEMLALIQSKGSPVIDATCPNVRRAQDIVSKLQKDDYQVIIVGEKAHPEVIGLLAHASGHAIVAVSSDELADIKPKTERVGIVVQTTQVIDNLYKVTKELISKCKEIRIFNTICEATLQRQTAAVEMAKKSELVLIIGGRNSANTTNLFKICHEYISNTFHIETADEIPVDLIKADTIVGVTAGASTVDWIIEKVIDKLIDIKFKNSK